MRLTSLPDVPALAQCFYSIKVPSANLYSKRSDFGQNRLRIYQDYSGYSYILLFSLTFKKTAHVLFFRLFRVVIENGRSKFMTNSPVYLKRKHGVFPNLVLGTAGLGGVWGKIDFEESVETVLLALELGVKRLDTAPAYNESEQIVGKALRQWNGPRPYVSTKVGRLKTDSAEQAIVNYKLDTMKASIQASMERLNGIDLLFLHEPEMVPKPQIDQVIDFLLEQKSNGTISEIGLGGIITEEYHDFIRQGIFDVIMTYNNLNACCLSGMVYDIPFFKRSGSVIYQGSPLHMGLLGDRFEQYQKNPPYWLSKTILDKAQMVKKLADYYELDLSALAHRFLLSVKEVDYLVLGPGNKEQLLTSLNDCKQGSLEKKLFDEIIDQT